MILAIIAAVGTGITTCIVIFMVFRWAIQHGGVRWWQLWIMSVILCAGLGAALLMLIQPFALRHIGSGAAIGAVIGAVYGLVSQIPQAIRQARNTQGSKRSRK